MAVNLVENTWLPITVPVICLRGAAVWSASGQSYDLSFWQKADVFAIHGSCSDVFQLFLLIVTLTPGDKEYLKIKV